MHLMVRYFDFLIYSISIHLLIPRQFYAPAGVFFTLMTSNAWVDTLLGIWWAFCVFYSLDNISLYVWKMYIGNNLRPPQKKNLKWFLFLHLCSKGTRIVLWTEDQEMELQRLFEEFQGTDGKSNIFVILIM